MTFSKEWNDRYQENTHLSIWPWSDLVSLVMRNMKSLRKNFRVLELGCGAGANIIFFQKLNAEYYAIDGSQHAITLLKEKYPELSTNLHAGDFTRDLYFPAPFDLIIDRSSLTHNHTGSIKNCLSLVKQALVPEGLYIGVDWFGTDSTDFQNGQPTDDPFTRTGYTQGPFSHVGMVHFSNRDHLSDLFAAFQIISLYKKMIQFEIPDSDTVMSSFNIVVRNSSS